MVGYKLSKNDWVTPFFVIFRSVREKLLVTVFFDHPVFYSAISANLFNELPLYSFTVPSGFKSSVSHEKFRFFVC